MTDLLSDQPRVETSGVAGAHLADALFAGPGEMRALYRAHDWVNTSLGAVTGWPSALRTAMQLVLDAPGEMCLYVGPEFATLYNDGYRTVLGGKHPAALGRPAAEVWREIWPQIGPQYDAVLAEGRVLDLHDVPFELTRLEGGVTEQAWFDYALSPVRDAGPDGDPGRVLGVLAVVTETTGRVRAERALAVDWRRLTDVFAQAPSFLAVLRGPENVFELVNPAYERIIGHGRDVIGKPLFDAIPETRGQGFDAYLGHVRDTGEPLVFRDLPVMLERAPGAALEERFLDITYLPLVEADGSHEAVIAHGTDVTEQVRARRALEAAEAGARHSAAQVRAFADAIPTLAWTARADGYITWYNARWYEYTGTTPADMEGWGWQQVHDPAMLPTVLERWQRSIATGAPFEMTFPLRGADGSFRAFLTRVVPARDADGAITGWFGTNTDVEVEIQLRRTAEEANRAKSEFLAIMSHELRTPLNAIGGYAALIELGIRGPVTDDQQADLARIQRSQRHLLGLINGVLNFAKLDAGTVDFTSEAVSLDEVMSMCELLILPQLRSKGIVLEIHGSTEVCAAQADREKTQQVLLNLLSNALKFTDPGGRVAIHCSEAPTGFVVVQVSDTGHGIAAEQLERIFQPFVQVDVALTRTAEGTGLGLAISRDLARGMGGDLTATSTPGVGSTFTLTLPRA